MTVVGLLLTVTAGPAAAATQNGCTFSVPKPTVASKRVSFTIGLTCSSYPLGVYDNRQMVVDLMGDDSVADDVMKYAVKGIWSNRSYSYPFSGWACNEDAVGRDELYLRVRTEKHQPGVFAGCKKASWVNGGVVYAYC